jgi:ATP-binding cassette subfamily F protein uup
VPAAKPRAKTPAKALSWAEQREWEGMEAVILAAEEALATCETAASDPAIATRADELAARCQALDEARSVVERLYERWAELDGRRG